MPLASQLGFFATASRHRPDGVLDMGYWRCSMTQGYFQLSFFSSMELVQRLTSELFSIIQINIKIIFTDIIWL